MVDIQSKEVIDKISEDLKVQPALQIPRALAEQIRLVYNVNPERLVQTQSATASDAAAETIHTTHATKDTYLISCLISVAKDAVSDSLFSSIKATPLESAEKTLQILRYEPTTARSSVFTLNFNFPMKLKRGTTITINNQAATASIDTTGIIHYFEVDPQ